MFTSRLWAAYGVTCLLTLVVGALVLHDLIGAILAGFQTVPYLFTCFVGLTLLSFVPRPPLRNPASQVAVFVVFSALSGLTAAAAGAALLPLLGQSAEFELHPAYYLDSLPVLGLTFIAIAFIHLTRHPHRRREHHQTSHLTD